MSNTPHSYKNSDCSFDPAVLSFCQSTPSTGNVDNAKHFNKGSSRKRKANFLDYSQDNFSIKKLTDVQEPSPTTPQFSSTFNDSLMNNLEKFHIDHEDSKTFREDESMSLDQGYFERLYGSSFKDSLGKANVRFLSAPNTPEKQIKLSTDPTRKPNTNSFIKSSLNVIQAHSPFNKDSYDILYPSLPSSERSKFVNTPQKHRTGTPIKKCLFFNTRQNLFDSVVSNNLIMGKILGFLSNGDLYRLSQVSRSFQRAIMSDCQASLRFTCFLQLHKMQKENYKITPPSSPEKDSGYEDTSPGSKNYVYFTEIARSLTKNQTMTKCRRCNKPSVVENHVGQCQDVNRCGYIFCLKCNSFANNPKDFKDECENAQLLNNSKPRNLLSDLSNCTVTSDYHSDNTTASFFSSSLSSSRYDSSGIFSECENATPKQVVKRNLTKSFITGEVKVLSSNNLIQSKEQKRIKPKASCVPVLASSNKKSEQIIEPSSPPKVKQYTACSKQSKRNLKRLTR